MLEMLGVGWRAGERHILRDVTFDVRGGELVALMGRNGSGKSTLLDIAAGLRVSSGTVRLDGRPLADWPPVARGRRISHLPQLVRAELATTVEQLVLMGRYPYATTWFESDEDRDAAWTAMRRCGCDHLAGRRVATLSGGERQRVLLASCLSQRAPLLLLDEPATFLDLDQQLHCYELLRAQADAGAACVAATHDLNLALAFCTRVLILADGALVHDLPVADAVEDQSWLQWFSPRLTMTRTPAGRAWVCLR